MTDRDPLVLSSALSVVAALVAGRLIATGPAQRSALLIVAVSLVGLGAGVRLFRRRHRLLGGLLAGGGAVGALFAFTVGRGGTLAQQMELYPVLVGPVVLVLGLAPVRRGWERLFVTTGSAIVLVGIVVSGIVQGASTMALLMAGVATVVAWDFGEQAVNVSHHVGTEAQTWPVELTHGAASLFVGAAAVGLALVVTGAEVTGVPLAGLGVLLGATVVLTSALYN